MTAKELSVVMSIFNRADLLRHGLASLSAQTLDPGRFEILIIDDGSTDDIRDAILGIPSPSPDIFLVQYDRKLHDVWQAQNPPDRIGPEVRWHTPSFAHNLGFRLARSGIAFVTQPEVVHEPRALEMAARAVLPASRSIAFGPCIQASADATEKIIRCGSAAGWGAAEAAARGCDICPESAGRWYSMAVDLSLVAEIQGCDEDYCAGVYGDDDEFRDRCIYAGAHIVPGGWRGVHLWHDDVESHRRRDTTHWREGEARNRRRYLDLARTRRVVTNAARLWGCLDAITSVERFPCT